MLIARQPRPDRSLRGDSAGPLPGIGERAFWVGLVIVIASMISGLATFLILTGLTPLVPRSEVVLFVLLLNILLVAAIAT